MLRIRAIAIFLVLLGCDGRIDIMELDQLNGYWEIDKVVLENGQIKTYEVNMTIDYIELKEQKGLRKKVYPNLDGSFDTSNDAEDFSIVVTDGHIQMVYKNDLSTWSEELMAIDGKSFIVSNTDNQIYHYKRFEPIKTTN